MMMMILNNVRQHNCFIIQGSYIGYMFRLIDQSSSSLFAGEVTSYCYTLRSQCVYINKIYKTRSVADLI